MKMDTGYSKISQNVKYIDFFPEGNMEEVSLDGVYWVSLTYKPQE